MFIRDNRKFLYNLRAIKCIYASKGQVIAIADNENVVLYENEQHICEKYLKRLEDQLFDKGEALMIIWD